jgi:anti-sigma regulatory factor (Ser/Thr protein kinase)/CheY-like chemotaxis protein
MRVFRKSLEAWRTQGAIRWCKKWYSMLFVMRYGPVTSINRELKRKSVVSTDTMGPFSVRQAGFMDDAKSAVSGEPSAITEAKAALMIGEDPEVKNELSQLLLPEGWTIHGSHDHEEALALVEEYPIDLVITSRATSGKEDVELLRRIRRVKSHTRVIILTDESTPEDVIASMREHAFGYLSKRFSEETLADTIHHVLETPAWDDGIEVISATPQLITLAVRCQLVAAERLLQFLGEITDLPESECRDVGMAFREMLLNAMEHGGNFDPNKYVEVCYVRTKHVLMARIKDPGDGFTLDEVRHAAIGNPPDDPLAHVKMRNDEGMRPGGYGVMLAKNLVDELIYGEKGNEVLLVKYLPGHDSSEAPQTAGSNS